MLRTLLIWLRCRRCAFLVLSSICGNKHCHLHECMYCTLLAWCRCGRGPLSMIWQSQSQPTWPSRTRTCAACWWSAAKNCMRCNYTPTTCLNQACGQESLPLRLLWLHLCSMAPKVLPNDCKTYQVNDKHLQTLCGLQGQDPTGTVVPLSALSR